MSDPKLPTPLIPTMAEEPALPDFCYCGDPECLHWSPDYRGYLYCRPHGEHHRPPECPVDEHGRACPWWDE